MSPHKTELNSLKIRFLADHGDNLILISPYYCGGTMIVG
jgi:hypothetical protein